MKIPSLREHKPSGRAVVTIKGRDHYLGRFGSKDSQLRYRRLLSEYLAAPEAFGIPPDSATIAELVLAYSKHCRKFYGLKEESEWWRVKVILRACRDLYADTLVSDFGPLQFRSIRVFIIDGQHQPADKKKRLSRRYINDQMKRLRRMFRWGVSEGIVPVTVYESLRAVEGLKVGREKKVEDRPTRQAVDDATVEATLKHLPPMVADIVRFQRLLGCRPSEALGITKSMIDRSKEVWEINLEQHKNATKGKIRTLYIGPKAQAILSKYLDDCRDGDFIFTPQRSERIRRGASRKTPLSCGNRPGKRSGKNATSRKIRDHFTPGTYANAIRRACVKAKVDRWTPYQLRHSKAVELLEARDIEAVKAVLGHSNTKMSDHYSKSDRKRAIEAAKHHG